MSKEDKPSHTWISRFTSACARQKGLEHADAEMGNMAVNTKPVNPCEPEEPPPRSSLRASRCPPVGAGRADFRQSRLSFSNFNGAWASGVVQVSWLLLQGSPLRICILRRTGKRRGKSARSSGSHPVSSPARDGKATSSLILASGCSRAESTTLRFEILNPER